MEKQNEVRRSGFLNFVDSIDLNLIPFKLYYFSFFFAHNSLLLFLPLYLKQLGLLASQVGLVVGLRYFLEIFGVFWGALADRYKRRKLFVLVALVAFTTKLMLFLSVQPHNEKCIFVNGTTKESVHLSEVVYSKDNDTLFLDQEDRNFPISHRNAATVSESPEQTVNLPNIKKSDRIRRSTSDHGKKYTKNSNSLDQQPQEAKAKIKNRKRAVLKDDNPPKTSKVNISETQSHFKRVVDRNELNNIFLALVLMTVAGELFGGSAIYTLMDSSTCEYLASVGETSKFGQVILFSQLASAMAVFTVGAILDTTNYKYCGEIMKNYYIPFYFFVAFNCVAFVWCATAKLGSSQSDATSQEKTTMGGLAVVLGNLRNISVLIVTAVFGCCLGLVLSFNLWFLDDLGATSLQEGLAQALYYSGDIITSYLSSFLIMRFGHIPLLVLPLANFSITLLCMSFVQVPSVGVLVFIFQGGMFGLAWPVLVSFFADQTISAGVINTIQGIVQALFWGIGFGGGISVAGGLINIYGVRVTYRIFSAGACATLVLFVIMQLVAKFVNIGPRTESSYQAVPDEAEAGSSSVLKELQ